jgi:hypothetical protein
MPPASSRKAGAGPHRAEGGMASGEWRTVSRATPGNFFAWASVSSRGLKRSMHAFRQKWCAPQRWRSGRSG